MCQTENKTPALSLEANLLAALLGRGIALDVAQAATKDVITTFANSEVAHPCWADQVRGIAPAESIEEKETTQASIDPDGTMELFPGVRVQVVRIGEDDKPEDVTAGMPESLKAVLRGIATTLEARRK
jgi:hypothetical protein